MTFKTDMETFADKGGSFPITEEMLEAHFIVSLNWTTQEYRATPQHVIDEILFYWQLQQIGEKANQRKNTPPPS